MDQNFPLSLYSAVAELFNAVQQFLIGLTVPHKLMQVAIILALYLLAWTIAWLMRPKFRERMRNLKGWPASRLRLLVVLNRKMTVILATIFLYIAYAIMLGITWPSHSYLIGVAAPLSFAWLMISIITRLIKNPFLRRLYTWAGWIIVTLYMFNLLEPATTFLDQIALEMAGVRLSLLLVIKAILTIALLIIFARMISTSAARRIEAIEDVSPSMKVLTVKILQFFLYGTALVFGIQSIGFDLTSLTVLSGAIGLGLGFGLQKVVSNLVSGVILLMDKSIKPGDVISLGDTFGWISQLGARYVSVLTRDGREYLIPNEDLITNQVVNWSHSSPLVRLDIDFGVSYDSNPRLVKQVASQAPLRHPRVINTPPPVCHVTEFADSSINFVLRFWIKDPTSGLTNIRGDVFLELWDALKENNISIPYPRRDVALLPQPQEEAGSKEEPNLS